MTEPAPTDPTEVEQIEPDDTPVYLPGTPTPSFIDRLGHVLRDLLR